MRHLQTWSITPRLSIKNAIFGMPSTDPDRHRLLRRDVPSGTRARSKALRRSTPTICRSRRWPATGSRPSACCRQRISPMAPACRTPALARGTASIRTRSIRVRHRGASARQQRDAIRLHVGLEHRFNNVFSVFGRAARAFRTPNVDERVPPARLRPFFRFPGPFSLKTQTSHDIEGGFRIKAGAFQMQSSIYNMDLENEIHFIPALFFNVNLDPTRRYGSETSASLRVSDSLLLRAGAAYTRAVFREGPFAGTDVPLVSHYTAMRRRDLEYLAELSGVRCHGACLERALHGQRPGQHPAPHSGQCDRRSEAERRNTSASSGRSA